ncbi:hypothetical protein WA845_02995 [Agrobacterium sp. CMT1]|uniref:hypothetical protein n=1 Tax=Agrobacterium sp. CMT1 TaxID=3128901 RepID=UPI00307820A2
MADYREISQEYARQGINAAFLLNGGAAVALLSQTAELIKLNLTAIVSQAMLIWAVGTIFAALTWVIAFGSTRYVDKSEREHSADHLATSDILMVVGLVLIIFSLVTFAWGCVALASGIHSIL